jgi:acyl transferase domain-containing protein/NAD(P)-dependent dehydrogenase (short-subunit alcohol dehydrogenase family)/acyl carrier protein
VTVVEQQAQLVVGGVVTAAGSAPTNATSAEPIAIIGMAGRFAGASNLDALWTLLREGLDAIREIPRDRYDIDAVYDPTPGTPGRTMSRWGGLLDDIAGFDAEFFGISPREADKMDPQQRLLLEVAYEALEDAGHPLEQLAASDTGVFIGQLGGDYWQLHHRAPEQLDLYAVTGAASRAITSGRVSYAFDLRGPSVTVDTACSSALVAVHKAVQALRLDECGLAIAGGVNIVLLPEDSMGYSSASMLAKDGRCKFGDASGDGFVRSDGIGAVILKPLARALADGDRIRAVLRGSAVGNDGQSSGYLVTPGVAGQREVLLRAYRNAGVDAADVDYIEAHGSGTAVGDPVELQALAEVLGPGRPADHPCLVGSIKTNIGHAEAAAGIAGLIKAVLCLEHAEIPPSLHLGTPNPAVPWDELPLRINTELTPLPDRGRPTLAGVSSFGFSGTNAHVVLEAAAAPVAASPTIDSRAELLTLTAANPHALITLAARTADHFTKAGRSQALRDLCHSAATRRTHHDVRLALPVTSHQQAAEALRAFADGRDEPGLSCSEFTEISARPRIAFVFPGQGSQWVGMGRSLLEQEPVFGAAMDACDRAISAETGWSVISLLRTGSGERLAELDVIQPTLWAMEIALAALWRSWGVVPDVVLGHSMGESAAAYVAGALSLADAAAVICRRSRLAKRLSGRGAMAWVALPAHEATSALAEHRDTVAVAAANSPTSTLLSGDPDALAQVLSALEARDVLTRLVNVDFASHCPQMDALRDDLLDALKDLSPRLGNIPLHSTLLNEMIDGSGLDAEYWMRNIREPVNFVGAVRGQLALGDTVFVEVSPHPLLVNGIREIGRAGSCSTLAVGSLRRDEDERTALLAAAGALYVAAVPLNLAALTAGGHYVPLPHYPWQHTTHWLPDANPSPATTPLGDTTGPPAEHPLLGPEVSSENSTRAWEGPLELTRNPYLRDHRIQDAIILPGPAHLELLTAAARTVLGDLPLALSGVLFHQALFVDVQEAPPLLRVTASPTSDGRLHCQVHSRRSSEDPWIVHSEATVRALSPLDTPLDGHWGESFASIRARCPQYQTGATFYPWHAERGNQWLNSFQGIAELWRTNGEALARLQCPRVIHDDLTTHHFHPALLDACGHALVAARPDVASGQDHVFVLGSIDEMRLYRRPSDQLYSHARLVPTNRGDSFAGDIRILDPGARPVAELRGLRLQYLLGHAPKPEPVPTAPPPLAASVRLPTSRDPYPAWLYEPLFTTAPEADHPRAAADEPGSWLVLTDSGVTGRRLVSALRDRGQHLVVVTTAARYQLSGTDRFRVDPDRSEDYQAVLKELADHRPFRGIVHLWALDATSSIDASAKEIERAEILVCRSTLHLLQALDVQPLRGDPRLWLVSQDSQAATPGDRVTGVFQAPLWGLGRNAAIEHPTLRPTLVDIDRDPASTARLTAELLNDPSEDQLAIRAGTRLVARLVRRRTAATNGLATAARISAPAPGILDDLALRPTGCRAPGPGEVVITVSHAALNYRDVLMAVGMYPGQALTEAPRLGWECSGIVTAVGEDVTHLAVGDEVIAITDGALATHVLAKAALVAPKPTRLSFAEAATVPAAFLTAYYALCDLGGMAADERVLIHSATGGVGHAALQIGRWKKARVYGTAGSPAKRQLLAQLGVEHAADSRSLAFVEEFRRATEGEGFDVILNTLTGEAINANLDLVAPHGRYLELSKRDILAGHRISLAPFTRNLSLHAIDVVHMITHRPDKVGALLREVCRLIEQGVLGPLPFTEYPAHQAADAFRLMGQAQHVGKIVLTFASIPPPTPSASDERPTLRPDATYLVTGGLGGIGGRLASWLVAHGARHLLLTGRRHLPDPPTRDTLPPGHPQAAAVALLNELTARGVHVDYAAVDVADTGAMQKLFTEHACSGKPKLRGVLHAAGTIDYMSLRDMSPEQLSAVLRAKVTGAWNLDRLLPDDLDVFVLFSSASSLLSSPTLGGYAAGNAFLDSLAHQRRARGATATVINWGFWDHVGMVARRERDDGRSLLPIGMSRFSPEDALVILGHLLAEGATQTAVLPADWPAWAAAYPAAAKNPLLRCLVTATAPQPTHPTNGIKEASATAVATAPSQAEPPKQLPTAPDRVQELVAAEVAQVLGLRADRINVKRPLNRTGLDSLMAVELRNRLERELQLKLPIVTILKGGSIASIAQAIHTIQASTSQLVPEPGRRSCEDTTHPHRGPGGAHPADRRGEESRQAGLV